MSIMRCSEFMSLCVARVSNLCHVISLRCARVGLMCVCLRYGCLFHATARRLRGHCGSVGCSCPPGPCGHRFQHRLPALAEHLGLLACLSWRPIRKSANLCGSLPTTSEWDPLRTASPTRPATTKQGRPKTTSNHHTGPTAIPAQLFSANNRHNGHCRTGAERQGGWIPSSKTFRRCATKMMWC